MPIAWRAAAETFEQILRQHGVQPTAVADVEDAWRAFADFMQTEIDGVALMVTGGVVPMDGFIVQWGRRSWDDNRLILTLTRQFEVDERDDPDWPGDLWHVELEIAFEDEPALIALESGVDAPDTGFTFEPVGPLRAAALAEVRAQAWQQALVRAMWTAVPVSSELSFECVG